MSRPIMAGALWLPTDKYDEAALIKRFTVKYWPLGAKTPTLVPGYLLAEGYVGVPRQIGLKLISNGDFEDQRSPGTVVVFPKTPVLWDYQIPFAQEIALAANGEYPDFMAFAATGKGKTVVALWVIGTRQVTAIALVDQERLMEQWIIRAQEHLGLDVDIPVADIMKGKGRDIGVVQGPRCLFEGKKFVVGMIQSLTQNEYPPEFYDYFGTVVIDEAHVAGAPVFSQVLLMFSALVRFGVSATPDRPDVLKKLLFWNLGSVEAHLGAQHQQSRVYYAESDAVVSWYANKAKMAGRYLQELSENAARNLLIVDAVQFLWKTGRDVLLVSDRVEQLCNLMALCRCCGIPEEDMGIYARSKVKWQYEVDPTPARRPIGWEKGTPYTPVRYVSKAVRTSKAELSKTFDEARLIFATYGMFEKGVDSPRLSAGIDCTPRSKAAQVHGRILRTGAGKRIPIWITIRDLWSFRAENQFFHRLNDYVQASNAEVFLWKPEKGIRKEDVRQLADEVEAHVRELKAQKIITRYDGSYTLATPTMRTVSAVQRGSPIARRTRYREAA